MNADEIFNESFEEWLRIEADHIMSGVSERTLCARLAIHIQLELLERGFSGYFVDVECNRMHDTDFKVILNDDQTEKRINADLIAHGRAKLACNDNLIAIEMKKAYRDDAKKDEDRLRLQSMTSPTQGAPQFRDDCGKLKHVAGYLAGRYIEVDAETRTISVEAYRNGELAGTESFTI